MYEKSLLNFSISVAVMILKITKCDQISDYQPLCLMWNNQEPITLLCCCGNTNAGIITVIFLRTPSNLSYRLMLCSLNYWFVFHGVLFQPQIFWVSYVTKWLIFENMVTNRAVTFPVTQMLCDSYICVYQWL